MGMPKSSGESGKGMSKANSRQRRTHAKKRSRYRVRMFTEYYRNGLSSRLGWKLRKRAKLNILASA